MDTSHTYLVPRSASGRDIEELAAKVGQHCARDHYYHFNVVGRAQETGLRGLLRRPAHTADGSVLAQA